MQTDFYRTLKQRVITQTPDGGGGYTETVTDTAFEGFIGMLSGSEITKNQAIGNVGTARLLTATSLSKTNRVVDDVGYFSEAGTVYEIVWKYQNTFETPYYDLKIV